ncbi:MAG: ABC transporter permease [Pseudomonadota bacterium]
MNNNTDNAYWTKIIQPRSGWFDLHLKELWRYRDLIVLFVRRNFVTVHKQTILGPLWYLIQPLFSTLVFTVIFGNIAKLPTDGLPPMLFYMSGIVTWNYFSGCLNQTSNTFVANAGIFGKVYFPRLTVPISVVTTNLLQFAIQFGLFLGFLFYFYFKGSSIHPHWWIFFTPLLILQMACLGLGLGIIVSSLTTKYRDLTYLVAFGVQLWMYATPIVYPISLVPSRYQWLLALNPMTAIVETFRFAFLGFLLYFYFKGSSIHPHWWIFFTPLLILQMACLGLGVGIIVSSLTTKYRDLTYLFAFGVQLWMYATPIVYPISLVPSRYQWLLALNPMTAIVEVFRYAFLGAGSIRPYHIGCSIIMTIFFLAVGIILFSRVEKTFMDTV